MFLGGTDSSRDRPLLDRCRPSLVLFHGTPWAFICIFYGASSILWLFGFRIIVCWNFGQVVLGWSGLTWGIRRRFMHLFCGIGLRGLANCQGHVWVGRKYVACSFKRTDWNCRLLCDCLSTIFSSYLLSPFLVGYWLGTIEPNYSVKGVLRFKMFN